MKTAAKNTTAGIASAVVIAIILALCACASPARSNLDGDDEAGEPDVSIPEIDTDATVRTGNGCDVGACIIFAQSGITLEGITSGVTVADGGKCVTVTEAGEYRLSGQAQDVQLRVNTADEKKVVLYFDGVGITCGDGPAVYIESATKKVVFFLVENSVNILADSEQYSSVYTESADESAPDAAVFSREDIEFDGEGTLYVTGRYDKGIVSKDDITVSGGSLFIVAEGDALKGKDSVVIDGGYINIDCGGDGIQSSNDEDTAKGFVSINGGTMAVVSGQDGIQAVTALSVNGGTLTVIAGGGSGANTDTHGEQGGAHGGGMFPGRTNGNTTGTQESDGTSVKGLKAGSVLTVAGGSVTVDANDDALHSNGDLVVSGGEIRLLSGSKGIHSDLNCTITDGTVVIAKSYEGVEAAFITVSGGDIDITSSDDGFNACNKTESASTTAAPGGFPGRGGYGGASSNALLKFTGGYTVVNAAGDGIDSNGNIEMTGGTVLVYGPTSNGNGAIDSGDNNNYCRISGGTLLAVGSSGMAESADNNGQAVISFRISNVSAGTLVYITAPDGSSVIAFKTPKTIQSVVFSSPALVEGESYKVYVGGSSSGEATDGVYDSGSVMSGGTEKGSVTAD